MYKNILELLNNYFILEEISTNEDKVKINKTTYDINKYLDKNIGEITLLSSSNRNNFIVVISPMFYDAPLLLIKSKGSLLSSTLSFDIFHTLVIDNFDNSNIFEQNKRYEILNNLEKNTYAYNDLLDSASIGFEASNKDVLNIVNDYIKAYKETFKYIAPCDFNLKKEKINSFIDMVIKDGGPITDNLKIHNKLDYVIDLYTKLFKK